MERVPEPEELMNDIEQALAYARADFSEANQLFISLLEDIADDTGLQGALLDLGCGPANIPLELARRHANLRIDALDGAAAMLDLARQHLDEDDAIASRIRLMCEYLPCPALQHGSYQSVVSNSLLHHLADPGVLWQTVRECAAPGAHVVVMDLMRPTSALAVDSLVETYTLDEPDVLRRDFRNSLFAAYTLEEVAKQLDDAGLDSLQLAAVSDRHLAVTGTMPA